MSARATRVAGRIGVVSKLENEKQKTGPVRNRRIEKTGKMQCQTDAAQLAINPSRGFAVVVGKGLDWRGDQSACRNSC